MMMKMSFPESNLGESRSQTISEKKRDSQKSKESKESKGSKDLKEFKESEGNKWQFQQQQTQFLDEATKDK